MIWASPDWLIKHYPIPERLLRKRCPYVEKIMAERDEFACFQVGEMVNLPYPGSEPLPQDEPGATGYVCAVDRDERTVTVSMQQIDDAIGDPSFPHLLYELCVLQGTQLPVAMIWPEVTGRNQLRHVASHFYASSPPER